MTLTNKIKAALLDFYIFQRSSTIACTELWDGFSIADFIAIVNDKIIEVEIKISVSDLKNELKKGREKYDWTIENDSYVKTNNKLITKHSIIESNIYYTPNKFYFCVPEYMLQETIEFVNKLNTKYGVIVFNDKAKIKDSLKIVKKAIILHKDNNVLKYENKMIDRICNDLTKKYRLLYY
jgi:predicted RNase H-related nuclease YkuK (DUF458 family)